MSRTTVRIVLGIALWVAWCILAVTELVPRIRTHVTMWPGLLAYVLCIAPLAAAGVFAIARSEET